MLAAPTRSKSVPAARRSLAIAASAKPSRLSASALVWVVAVALIGPATWSSAREHAPTAKSLTPEQWRAYDRLFFNEATLWRYNSAAYDPRTRPRLFREMAAEGFKVAALAPQLLNQGSTRDPAAAKTAFESLRVLADSGDTSAMCFMPLAWSRSVLEEAFPSYESMLPYIKKGAASGHPYCRLVVARLYGSGSGGFPRDLDRAMQMVREVARERYYEAHVALFRTYAERIPIYEDMSDLRRVMCWGRLAQQHSNWTGFDSYTDRLRAFAVANKRPDLLQLEREWDTRSIPVEEKRVTPEDCLAMEPGN